jgi:hypothetical protein
MRVFRDTNLGQILFDGYDLGQRFPIDLRHYFWGIIDLLLRLLRILRVVQVDCWIFRRRVGLNP